MAKLHIINRNGTLRVHKAGCGDIKREAKGHVDWPVEANTRKEVVLNIYPPDDFSYDPETEWEQFDDFELVSCAKGELNTPTPTPAQATEEPRIMSDLEAPDKAKPFLDRAREAGLEVKNVEGVWWVAQPGKPGQERMYLYVLEGPRGGNIRIHLWRKSARTGTGTPRLNKAQAVAWITSH